MEIDERKFTETRETLAELLKGGFAPVVILLREFHYDKAGIVLDGLHFSAFSLLGHMYHRQKILLDFMQSPIGDTHVWPDAYWPQQFEPHSDAQWLDLIANFEADLNIMISIVKDPSTDLFEKKENGMTVFWAVTTNLQHNGYHIGQIKAVGRQLGVW